MDFWPPLTVVVNENVTGIESRCVFTNTAHVWVELWSRWCVCVCVCVCVVGHTTSTLRIETSINFQSPNLEQMMCEAGGRGGGRSPNTYSRETSIKSSKPNSGVDVVWPGVRGGHAASSVGEGVGWEQQQTNHHCKSWSSKFPATQVCAPKFLSQVRFPSKPVLIS